LRCLINVASKKRSASFLGLGAADSCVGYAIVPLDPAALKAEETTHTVKLSPVDSERDRHDYFYSGAKALYRFLSLLSLVVCLCLIVCMSVCLSVCLVASVCLSPSGIIPLSLRSVLPSSSERARHFL
jgi:hypothetical protein